ncbi:MAG: hypothetical protein JEZ08_08250 [Clostridiales bacterium]|nr:hypothetical protein [Clostridiales bacterium]
MNKTYLKHLEDYGLVYKTYIEYSIFLSDVLSKACDSYAPKSLVQSRAKSLSSYAEKIIRKEEKIASPLEELTDLAGARVITQTKDQLDDICEFIEHYFKVDYSNSLNKSDILNYDQFGYMSVHYVVSVPDDNAILGFLITDDIRHKKAEIQVRTLLQHVWSEMDHDRFYKASFNVPKHLRRDDYRLAAIIENTDALLSDLIKRIGYFENNYTPFLSEETILKELTTLKTLYNIEPDPTNKPHLLLKISKLSSMIGEWEFTIKIGSEFLRSEIEINDILLTEIRYMIGQAYIMSSNPENDYINKGINIMTELLFSLDNKKFNSSKEKSLKLKTIVQLAKAYNKNKNFKESKRLYFEAYQIDSNNPYILEECLHYYSEFKENDLMILPVLENSIQILNSHIDSSIELPNALFLKARFNFLLGRIDISQNEYIAAFNFCKTNKILNDKIKQSLLKEVSFFKTLIISKEIKTTLNILELFLLNIEKTHKKRFKKNILLGVDNIINPFLLTYYNNLINSKNLMVSTDYVNHSSFDAFLAQLGNCILEGNELFFYVLGENTNSIKGIRLLLSLGINVIILKDTTIVEHEIINDSNYINNRNIIILPNDYATLSATVLQQSLQNAHSVNLKADQILRVAKSFHDSYVTSIKTKDISQLPWDDLESELKTFNISQAKFIEVVLAECDYTIRESSHPKPIHFNIQELNTMAEMVYGKKLSSKILDGWSYSKTENIKEKKSSTILPWSKLDDDIRNLEIDNIKNYSQILNSVGFEIYKELGRY